MILVDALYINTGGAKVVFESILKELVDKNLAYKYFFLVDNRLNSDLLKSINKNSYLKIESSLINRKTFYVKNKNVYTKIICLANLPPPIMESNIKVYIFFHNAHILKPNLKIFRIISIIKYTLKLFYILLKNKKRYNWIVQTEFMKSLIISRLFINKSKISILPIFNEQIITFEKAKESKGKKVFAYIADGQTQKNHSYIFEAWKILSYQYNINYKLLLTISNSYPGLINQIKRLNKIDIDIENLGFINHSKINEIYQNIDFLIYPSLVESFGLPLIEATQNGCDIIAIDKEYVFNVIKPSCTFSNNRVLDLVKIVVDIHKGITLPRTTLVVSNKINEFIELINE